MNQAELNTILADHAVWLASKGASGVRADLTGAVLRYANLSAANLSHADLSGANLQRAVLRYANLSAANLTGADLRDADLSDVDLCGAHLRAADMQGTYLQDANLWGADLQDANLWGADLRGANLREVNLRGANLRDCTGNRKQIKSIFISAEYPIIYTADVLQIGCEQYLISEWAQFDDDRIMRMDGDRALNFWHEWKELIFIVIEKSPAEPTAHSPPRPGGINT